MLDRLVALALATSALSAPQPPPPAGLPLPAPRGPLVFDAGAKEISLDTLLRTFAQLTGQELAMGMQDLQILQQAREPLESTEPVPAEEIYTFVEGLISRHGVLIAPISGGSRPILGVYTGAGRGAALPNPEPLLVSLEQLSELERHPALLVRLIFPFQNTDARQVQTQLRQVTVDPLNMTQIVPVGELSLLMQGRAKEIAGLVRLLQQADEHAGRTRLPSAPKPEGEGAK
ncbi:MAG TPA: hypothetical protein VF530_15565 [Planctomycetota bacterium]